MSWGLTSINYIASVPLLFYFLLGLPNNKHWKEIRWWKRENWEVYSSSLLHFSSPADGFDSVQPLHPSMIATSLFSILVTMLFFFILQGNGTFIITILVGFTFHNCFLSSDSRLVNNPFIQLPSINSLSGPGLICWNLDWYRAYRYDGSKHITCCPRTNPWLNGFMSLLLPETQ